MKQALKYDNSSDPVMGQIISMQRDAQKIRQRASAASKEKWYEID